MQPELSEFCRKALEKASAEVVYVINSTYTTVIHVRTYRGRVNKYMFSLCERTC